VAELSVKRQARLHRGLKYLWLALGLWSLSPLAGAETFRNSVAVVVFISIYANYVSHWSTERALEAQQESRRGNPDLPD